MPDILTSVRLTESLVTLARRYCKNNYEFWCQEYEKKRSGNDYPYTYTDEDYNLFPRYNVLNAILLEVETLTGGEFSFLPDCRELLVLAGQIGETVFTTGKQNEIARRAMMEERNKFAAYIHQITEADLQDVEPLPYERHLRKTESAGIRKNLLQHWNFDGGYWEPIGTYSSKPVHFLAQENITPVDRERIKVFIAEIADGYLYRMTEWHVDYQIENIFFEFDSSETVYCDSNYDWIVYISHENTVTFGGDELVAFIRCLYRKRMELIDVLLKYNDYNSSSV